MNVYEPTYDCTAPHCRNLRAHCHSFIRHPASQGALRAKVFPRPVGNTHLSDRPRLQTASMWAYIGPVPENALKRSAVWWHLTGGHRSWIQDLIYIYIYYPIPIGSIAIYDDIYHQYTPNVSIYTIHGSYGILLCVWHGTRKSQGASIRKSRIFSAPH